MPSFTEVDDPNIREVYYDEGSQTLILYMRRGGTRTYTGIPPRVAATFTRSLDLDLLEQVSLVSEVAERTLARMRAPTEYEELEPEEAAQLDLLVRYDEVSSTAIRALQYDEASRRVTAYFTDGNVYSYDGISPRAYQAFLKASSIGRYFNLKIR